MRLDRALARDLRTALGSWPLRVYLLLQPMAALVLIARRGPELASSVLLIWVGLSVLAFTAWWAGRHRLAQPRPDVVSAPGPRSVFALLAVAGATIVGFGGRSPEGSLLVAVGVLLAALGIGGWTWSALRSAGVGGLRRA